MTADHRGSGTLRDEGYSQWGVGQASARCRRVREMCPDGSQRNVSTAVPATLLLARITSVVDGGAVSGRLEPAPQPATVSAAATTAMIAAIGLIPMLVKTAAHRGKFPGDRSGERRYRRRRATRIASQSVGDETGWSG